MVRLVGTVADSYCAAALRGDDHQMITGSYVPILKAREAEILALRARPATLSCTPYFELQSVTGTTLDPLTGLAKRKKSAVTDASYFLDDVARLWGEDLYLDITRVAQAHERESWWQLITSLTALSQPQARIIPAVAENDPTGAWLAAAPLASLAGRTAVRIALPHANPSKVGSLLARVSAATGVPVEDIDVVLDWGDRMEVSLICLDDLTAHTELVLAHVGLRHGRVITAGTPNSKDFVQVGDWDRARREWWLWLRLTQGPSAYDVTFGDYALYPPSDPAPVTPQYGHLRYSSGDRLHVHRRAKPKAGGGLAAAFSECCTYLTSSSHYLGAGFSAADGTVSLIASGLEACGKAGTWRQLSSVHHIALVDSQLAAPPAPPAAGTL